MTLGQNIKTWRARRGLTQQELAVRAGIGTAQLSNLENDHTKKPTLYKILGIARALGITVETLVQNGMGEDR